MFDRMTRALLGILAVMLCVGVAHAEGRKLALVVGNEAYEALPGLATPAADAQAMSKALRDLGFEVTLLTDVGPEVFQAVLGSFAEQSERAETVLFYYSGHAFQKDGVNHLVPVNARLADAGALEAETWRLDDIAAKLKSGSGQLLLFLDACRDNPLPAAVVGSGGPGLAQFDGGAGTFVAFATAPGAVAWDTAAGTANSPFTAALLDHIATSGQSISDLMIAVRNAVDAATQGKQTPWEQSSLREQFFFVPKLQDNLALELPKFEMAEVSVEIAAADEGAAVAQIAGVPVRLAALNAATRSLAAVGGVQTGALRLKGIDGGNGGDGGAAPALAPMAIPENLPLAVQTELQRIGCYAMAVDGDWGNGSRKAMAQYYAAKKVKPAETEPTAEVYLALAQEPVKTCDKPAAVVEKKAPSKATAKKATAKATKKTPTTKKAAAPKTAAPAPEKKGVKCKFLVVAVVCS
jgi:hypothetical protein